MLYIKVLFDILRFVCHITALYFMCLGLYIMLLLPSIMSWLTMIYVLQMISLALPIMAWSCSIALYHYCSPLFDLSFDFYSLTSIWSLSLITRESPIQILVNLTHFQPIFLKMSTKIVERILNITRPYAYRGHKALVNVWI